MASTSHRDFEIGVALGFAWDRFTGNLGLLALAALVVFLVNMLLSALGRDGSSLGGFVFSVISFFVSQLIAMGWVRISLNVVDGKPASVGDLWARLDLLLPYAIASFLFSIMVGVGLVLLVIPGIYLALTFSFYGPVIVDREMGAIDGLRRSAEITRGHKWKLLGFWVTLLLLNLLGLILLVVGVLVTAAVSLLAIAYVYRTLSDDPRGLGKQASAA